MSPSKNISGIRSDFWHSIDQRIEDRVGDVIDRRLRNYRPLGVDSWDFNAVSTSLTVPAGMAYIPYPCYIDRVEIGAMPAGNVTLDILVARPGLSLLTATSRVGLTPPVLVAGTFISVPAGLDWVINIEGGSWILVYVTDMTADLCCGAVIVRCV